MRKLYIQLFIFIFICSVPNVTIIAQLKYSVSSDLNLGNGNVSPFWFSTNKQGIVPITPNNGNLRLSFFSNEIKRKEIGYKFGLDVIEQIQTKNQFFIQQAFVDITYRKGALSMGAKEKNSILKNSELSIGGLSYSGNARPIPEIRLGTNEFVTFPWLLNRDLSVKTGFSYGWLTDNVFQKEHRTVPGPYNQNTLYHHKDFNLNYHQKQSKWWFDFAIETNTMFGSSYYTFDIYNNNKPIVIESNPTLKHYLMTLLPLPGDKSSVIEDQNYLYGSSNGSEHLRISYEEKNYFLRAYYENYFDDFSGFSKQNGFDGVWGLEYEKKSGNGITGIVVEYLQTTHQSGPIHWMPYEAPDSPLTNMATGSDNYYNNHSFAQGYAHHGMNIGNALLTSPIYNTNGSLWHYNNRVKGLNLGISFSCTSEIKCRILNTFSQSFGTMDIPFRAIKNQYSGFAEIKYQPRNFWGWSMTLRGAIDRGDNVFGNSEGVSLTIKKSGTLF